MSQVPPAAPPLAPRPGAGVPPAPQAHDQSFQAGSAQSSHAGGAAQPSVSDNGIDSMASLSAEDKLLESERQYTKALKAISGMMRRLELMNTYAEDEASKMKPILTQEEIGAVFLNIKPICEMHRIIYKDLKLLKYQHNVKAGCGPVFVNFIPFIKLYTAYVAEYPKSVNLLTKLRQKFARFDEYIRFEETLLGAELSQMREAPLHRIPQYVGILEEFLATLSPSEPNYGALDLALNGMKDIGEYINRTIKHMEARREVVVMQEIMFQNELDLVTPDRYFVKKGILTKEYNKSSIFRKKTEYLFVLFSDVLLYATIPDKRGRAKMKHVLSLAGMRVEEVDGKRPYGFKAFSDTKEVTMFANDDMEKQAWIAAIRDKVKELEQNYSTLAKDVASGQDIELRIKRLVEFVDDEDAPGSDGQAGGPQDQAGAPAAGAPAVSQQQQYSDEERGPGAGSGAAGAPAGGNLDATGKANLQAFAQSFGGGDQAYNPYSGAGSAQAQQPQTATLMQAGGPPSGPPGAPPGPPPGGPPQPVHWIKQFDPNHGRHYFHCPSTGATVWEEPTGAVYIEEIDDVWGQ